MGYQVGNVCYPEKALAENAYFSQVSPVLTSDGSLKMLSQKGGKWFYGSVQLKADLPECSALKNFNAGVETFAPLIGFAVFLFGAKLITRLLQ